MSHQAYLGLGTNLCSTETSESPQAETNALTQNLKTAIQALQEHIGLLLKCSSFIETEPWGFQSEHRFLNAVALFETELTHRQLLRRTQEIERQMGRTHKSTNAQYHDRIIDIDILFYDDLILNTPNLQIPHPLIEQRQFVLVPLAEIAPDLIHPCTKKRISQALEELNINKGRS